MTRITDILSPFMKNKNTGNLYEISTALSLLRKMGIDNDELDTDAELLEKIALYNEKKTAELRGLFVKLRTKAVGTGLVFDGNHVVRIECITQDDSVGRTGDLLLHTDKGIVLSLSICEGKPKRDGEITKCLTNPSAKRFGCDSEDIKHFVEIEQQAVKDYKEYMTANYGSDETKWPSRVKTTIATEACTKVGRAVQERFVSFDKTKQRKIMEDILRIEGGNKPADYLALVDKNTLEPRFYKFESMEPTIWEPTIEAVGINLIVKNSGISIGSIQVKFNNGIYHNGKTSSIHTSWNATFQLSKLFKMKTVV